MHRARYILRVETESMKGETKQDPTLVRTLEVLVKVARENDSPVWRDIADRLDGPTRTRAEVNVSTLERSCSEGDVVAVPGKVLGSGRVTKELTVGAFGFSNRAQKLIESAGGRTLSLTQLAEEEPGGRDVRIME